MRNLLTFRTLLIGLCVGFLGFSSGCGARQDTPTRLPALEASSARLPSDIDALRAWLQRDPDSAEDAFFQAYAHMLDVNVEAMHAVLRLPIFDDAAPMLRVGRMALLMANVESLIDKAPLRAWASDYASVSMLPQEQVLFTELQHGLRMEQLDHEDEGALPSALSVGGADSWNVMGPISLFWSDEVLEQGIAGEVQSLEELPLRGRQRRQVYPTVLGIFAHNPQPQGLAYYESFVRVSVPTRVAVTRFAARDYYSVWIDDTRVMHRGALDADASRYQMPVYDLSPGVYRVLMAVRSSDTQIQPPHLISLQGRIDAFSAAEGPAQGGTVARVEDVASDLTRALATGQDENVQTWLVHAAVAMLSDDALGYELAHNDVGAGHPVVELVRARLLDMARDAPISASLALQTLRAIPESWGELRGVALKEAELVFQSSQDIEAARTLAPLANEADAPPHLRASFAYMLRQSELNALAYTQLKALSEEHPQWCSVWEDYLRLSLHYRGVLDDSDFDDAPMHCPRVRFLKLQVTDHWRGNNAEYTAAYRRAVTRSGHAPGTATDLFWALLEGEGIDAAKAYLSTLEAYGLRDDDVVAERAAIALLEDGAAGLEELLQHYVHARPTRGDTHMVLARLSGLTSVEDLRFDADAALQDYQKSSRASGPKPDSVYVVDYQGWRLFKNGGALKIEHKMVELNSNEAIADAGEIALPQDAETLRLRVIKPDGSTRAPEQSSEKSSLSMPDMQVGDVLEMETLTFVDEPNDGRISIRPQSFTFSSHGAPMLLSQWRVDYPEEWADDLVVETFNFDGAHEKTTEDGRVREVFTVRDVPSIRAERWMPPLQEVAPWLQMYAYAGLDAQLNFYNDMVRTQVAPSKDIDRLTREIIADAKTEREQLRQLFRYVVDEVEETAYFFGVNARQTARVSEGSRLSLLYAMLASAGFEPELTFIKTYDTPIYTSEVIDLDMFYDVALYVETKKSAYWMELFRDFVAFDQLPLPAQAQPAIIITGERRGTMLQTPNELLHDAQSRMDTDIWLDANGDARLEVYVVFERDEQPQTRQTFAYTPNTDDRQRLLERYLSRIYGQVTVTDFTIDNEDDPDKPLGIRVHAEVNAMADVGENALTIDRSLGDVELLTSYTTASARTYLLMIDTPLVNALDITIHPPEDYRVTRGVSEQTFADGAHTYVRTIKGAKDQRVQWHRQLTVQRDRVGTQEYPSFATFGQQVRNAERVRIQWRKDDATD